MIAAVVLISVLLVCNAAVPGRLAVWSNQGHGTKNLIQHISSSLSTEDAASKLHQHSAEHDVTIILKKAGLDATEASELLSHENVAREIRGSRGAQLFTNVVRSRNEAQGGLREHIAKVLSSTKEVSLAEAVENMKKEHGAPEQFEVSVDLSNAEQQAHLDGLFAAARQHPTKKILFAALEEASVDAVLPTERGHYERVTADLNDHQALTTSGSIKGRRTTAATSHAPIGGTEFSIYYEGTYLYITPDLFTGIMTALFMFFVALTGLRCLGSIQGMSSFYDKVPTNGREA